ncbi:methyl-accepting chemotaxis protein [Corynebacterium diphtheriae]
MPVPTTLATFFDVIKGISQQTNLLALKPPLKRPVPVKPAVGFAVVADEVRNLAHRTQESAGGDPQDDHLVADRFTRSGHHNERQSGVQRRKCRGCQPGR